ncbi:type 1 fimbria pilin [Enterobacillus tribolii]|uniref:Type 1 fimbria pilin n=2 Tax=Enterobacillus tribolii TaxID=1487935 RepID=A0A370R1M5_9GAMM|nr:type 1 fimbria pilin [Enterobacillus tribolii]
MLFLLGYPLLGYCAPAAAKVVMANLRMNPGGPFNYKGPADPAPVGEQLGNGWSGEKEERIIFECPRQEYCITYAEIRPVKAALPGIKYTDGYNQYDVYESGVPGIGYVLGIRDPNANRFIPGNAPVTQTFPADGTNQSAPNIGYRGRIIFVISGSHLQTGTFTIPAQTVAYLHARGKGVDDQSLLSISAVTIKIAARGCEISSSKSFAIDLGDAPMNAFPAIGSRYGGKDLEIQLKCDTGTRLHAVMTDQSQPGNTSNILTLTPDSGASGVGIQFFYDNQGTPLSFGPDLSSTGVLNQWFIKEAIRDGESIRVPLTARYVRTGEVTPGSANGRASITFSYQ